MASSQVSIEWSWEENKKFEDALAEHLPIESEEDWKAVASTVPTKTMEQVKQHYQLLIDDINVIEAGIIPFPNYIDDLDNQNSVDLVKTTSFESVKWSWEENKTFEDALPEHLPIESEEGWKAFAYVVPTKTMEQVTQHYQDLIDDINSIEAGLIPPPNYHVVDLDNKDSVDLVKTPVKRASVKKET